MSKQFLDLSGFNAFKTLVLQRFKKNETDLTKIGMYKIANANLIQTSVGWTTVNFDKPLVLEPGNYLLLLNVNVGANFTNPGIFTASAILQNFTFYRADGNTAWISMPAFVGIAKEQTYTSISFYQSYSTSGMNTPCALTAIKIGG